MIHWLKQLFLTHLSILKFLMRSIIFNFNNFVNNLDVKAFLDDTLPSYYTGSPFVHKDHNHVIKGNLKIIENNKLRKLFSESSKYCEKELLIIKKFWKA